MEILGNSPRRKGFPHRRPSSCKSTGRQKLRLQIRIEINSKLTYKTRLKLTYVELRKRWPFGIWLANARRFIIQLSTRLHPRRFPQAGCLLVPLCEIHVMGIESVFPYFRVQVHRPGNCSHVLVSLASSLVRLTWKLTKYGKKLPPEQGRRSSSGKGIQVNMSAFWWQSRFTLANHCGECDFRFKVDLPYEF